jgi:hypothetical protein
VKPAVARVLELTRRLHLRIYTGDFKGENWDPKISVCQELLELQQWNFKRRLSILEDRLCGLVLATDPKVPGSIPGDTRFSEK